MRKVALTADLQVQSQPRYSTLAPSGVSTRLEDFLACFHWIADTAVENGCDTLFILGDLLDSRTVIDVSVIDRVCRSFRDVASSLEIHILIGNHDAYLRTPTINSTQMFLGHAHVHETVEDCAPFVVVPWVDDVDAYQSALSQADKINRKGDRFLLSHGMFGDAVPMAKGLPVEWLQGSSWRGVFLGDVHDPVVLHKKPLIRYVGSPLQIHFGDAGRSRGFLTLDTSSGKTAWFENRLSPRFHILRDVAESELIVPTTKRDFFRVAADDSEVSDVLTGIASAHSSWVEASAVSGEDQASTRIQAAGSMADGDLLRAYCEQVNVSPDLLVDVGLELLAEARNQ